jgi:phage shock protein PspC (stress-responsive transcriptional regulator)
MNWLRENYGWQAKRTEYLWLLMAVAGLIVLGTLVYLIRLLF